MRHCHAELGPVGSPAAALDACAREVAALGASVEILRPEPGPGALEWAAVAARRHGPLRGLVWAVGASAPATPEVTALERLVEAEEAATVLLSLAPSGGAGSAEAAACWAAFARRPRRDGQAPVRLVRWRAAPAAADCEALLPSLLAHAVPEMEAVPAGAELPVSPSRHIPPGAEAGL